MSDIEIVSSNWPVVVCVYPPKMDIEDAMRFVGNMRTLLFAKPVHAKFGCISDLTRLEPKSTDAKARTRMAEALSALTAEVHARGGPHMVADARVLTSPVVRGLATAMEWIRREKDPVRYFPDRVEALKWVNELLRTTAK